MKSATRGSSSTKSTFTRLPPWCRPAMPEALFVHRRGAAAPAEALEHPFQFLRRNADAAVGNAYPDFAIGAANLDPYGSLGFGVPHCIIKKHEEKLPEPRRVASHHVMRGAVDKGDIHAPPVSDHVGIAAHLLQQVAEIDGLQVEARGAGALTGNEQKVVNQNGKVLSLLDDALDRALIFGNRLIRPAQRDLALAADDGQRRAELVADIGEEAAAGLVDLAQGLVGLAKLLGAFFHFRFKVGMGILQGLLVSLEVL